MGFNRRAFRSFPAILWIGIASMAIASGAGCRSVGHGEMVGPTLPTSPEMPGPVVVDSPHRDDHPIVSPASLVETWVVHTRACEQTMGSNPWPSISVSRLDEQGGPLHGADPEALLDRMAGRHSVILIHGAEYTHQESTKEAIQIRAQLEALGGLDAESLFIVFDWPSERALRFLPADLNEKARRSRVAGYHLARFLQASPPNSMICMMGQSDGGRVALTTSHLLSGAVLPRFLREPPGQLTSSRTDLRIRNVVLETAAGNDWLNPGRRLEQALPMSEAVLNLYNPGDFALAVYTLGAYTGVAPALGSVGLTKRDLKKIGPPGDRVEQINLHRFSGNDHTSFTQALTYPGVADRIVAYTSFSDVSSKLGSRTKAGKDH